MASKTDDFTPGSAAETSIPLDPSNVGAPGDSFGSRTAASGTAILNGVPCRAQRTTRVKRIVYDCAGTAHIVTTMVALALPTVASEVAAGQLTIKFSSLPVLPDGGVIAQGDHFMVMDETGFFGVYRVNTLSGNTVTIYASVGDATASGFPNKIEKDTSIAVFGVPANHTLRQYTMRINERNILEDPVTAGGENQPVLIHVDNATNAGTLIQVVYEHAVI